MKNRPAGSEEEEPPAGFEPAPRPYDGRVLAADTTEAEKQVEMPGVEPDPPRCKRGALPVEPHPQGDGGRPDSNGRRGDHDPECLPLHHGHSGDGRARTGGLSPDRRALWPSELRPHLESRGWDSNPRSRAHEAREDNRSSTALLDLAGRTRTCDLRLPGPVGWPAPHSQMADVVDESGTDVLIVQHPRRDSNPQPPG